MPKIGSGGRPGAARPADRPVDARLKRPHNVPREGTSHLLFPPSRRLRRPSAQESGGSIAGWHGPIGAMPFHPSRGRPTAGEASDRSGVVVRHTTTSRVLGGWILRYRVGSGDPLLKRAAVLSLGGTGQWVRCQRSGRKTDQRPEIRKIVSRGGPAGGADVHLPDCLPACLPACMPACCSFPENGLAGYGKP